MDKFYEENDEEFEEEIIEQIKQTVKLTIKTLEIYWEELQKSKLPEDIKVALLKNFKVEGDK